MSNEKGEINHTDLMLKKYENIVNLYIHANNNYWKVYSLFLIIMGLLFAGFAQIIKYGTVFASLYCIIGILISIIWLPVIRRNIVYADIAEDLGRNLEKDLFNRDDRREIISIEKRPTTKVRRKDWDREMKLHGKGYFQSTQLILSHEMKEKPRDSWINERYENQFERDLITWRRAVTIMSIYIPIIFLILWGVFLSYMIYLNII